MLTKMDIQKLVDECRVAGEHGLGNGCKATIQELEVVFLAPPSDFLGVGSNPAIFINHRTYSLLGKFHKNWAADKTIAVKENFLDNEPIKVIGIIVHETGHAFNVAANIPNSEANAYIFEIEVMSIWFKMKNPLLLNCSEANLHSFFQSRLAYYRMETENNEYLAQLVMAVEKNTIFESMSPKPLELKKTPSPRFVVQTPKLADLHPCAFFKHSPAFLKKISAQEALMASGSLEPPCEK